MLALYVHIPFCRKKCSYCSFNSFVYDEFLADKFLDLIEGEISLAVTDEYSPDTLYIGGGTPSVLSANQLERLFVLLKKKFRLEHVKEASVECNPESLDEYKLEILKAHGINRLSIGLQSFSDDLLARLGRIHNAEKFQRAYSLSRAGGFDNINVDLIYGIPGQSLDEWKKELESIVTLCPEHISSYALSVEYGTEFFNKRIEVDDDLQADMFEAAISFLKTNGYEHYEISNFGKRRCLHNQVYWKNEPYIGLGPGAVSYIGGKRSKNVANLLQYATLVERDMRPLRVSEELEGEKKSAERIMLGLRMMEGIELLQDESVFREKLEKLQKDDFIEYKENRWRLTYKGILFSSHVFREIL